MTKAERDLLEVVEKYGARTSKELPDRFGLLPSAASNRLKLFISRAESKQAVE